MIGPGPSCAPSSHWLPFAMAIALGAPFAQSAAGQVIEIGQAGEITTYDQPSVFTSTGAEPIRPEAAPRAAAAGPPSADPAASPLVNAASAVELSPDLVEAVAWTESRGRAGAVSRAGAVGEMQLMPGTARGLGVNPYDTSDNYRGGAAYLRQMMQRYDGDLPRALAAYNAGPGAVDRYSGVPPYRETRAYVNAILDRLSHNASGSADQTKKGL